MIDPDAQEGLLYQSEQVEPDWYKTNIPCQVGCPAQTDVSNYIGLISQGRFDDAYVLNRKSNVVPGVLGRTCARPCEPVCRRNKIDGNPVAICWLKRAAHDHREYPPSAGAPAHYQETRGWPSSAPARPAWPARATWRRWATPSRSTTCTPPRGGMMVGGIPVWRLPREVTHEECDEYLDALGIEVRLNTTRRASDVQLTDLLNEYDAVYIAAGCYALKPHDRTRTTRWFRARTCKACSRWPAISGEGQFRRAGLRRQARRRPGRRLHCDGLLPLLGPLRRRKGLCRSIAARKKRCPRTSTKWTRRCWSMSSSSIWLTQVEILSNDGVHVSGIKLIRNRWATPMPAGGAARYPIPGSEFVHRRGHSHRCLWPVCGYLLDSRQGTEAGGQ